MTIILDIAAQYLFRIIFAFSRIFAIPFLLRGNDSLLRKTAKKPDLRENYISHRKPQKAQIFFSTTNCTNFTNYDDIAAQYRFRIIFAISRIFAIPFLRGNDSLLRKTAENTDLRENFISHRKYRNFFGYIEYKDRTTIIPMR